MHRVNQHCRRMQIAPIIIKSGTKDEIILICFNFDQDAAFITGQQPHSADARAWKVRALREPQRIRITTPLANARKVVCNKISGSLIGLPTSS